MMAGQNSKFKVQNPSLITSSTHPPIHPSTHPPIHPSPSTPSLAQLTTEDTRLSPEQ